MSRWTHVVRTHTGQMPFANGGQKTAHPWFSQSPWCIASDEGCAHSAIRYAIVALTKMPYGYFIMDGELS
jgi:hypothetical protein